MTPAASLPLSNTTTATDSHPTVSVIIPVYNTGTRLRGCLESILVQTYWDYECLIIDDGSTDSSPRLIQEFVQRDRRFRGIRKPNGGVSSARNQGLDLATGEWVVFVDSDDRLKPNHLEEMLANTRPEVDMVVTGYEDIFQDGSKIHSYPKAYHASGEGVRDFLCHTDAVSYMILWEKMFRRDIISQAALRFDERLSISEDRLFVYHFLLHIRALATTGEVTYLHDASDPGSLTYRSYSTEVYAYRFSQLAEATVTLLRHWRIKGDEGFGFWIYVWRLFTGVIRSIESTSGNLLQTIKAQEAYFNANFPHSLYQQFWDGERVQAFMQSRENRYILHQRFLLYNLWFKAHALMHKLHLR